MSIVKKYLQSPVFWIVITLFLYSSGAILMETPNTGQLKEAGLAEQQEHVVINQDGEEYYVTDSMIEIEGIGSVLTYRDVYFFSIPLFFVSMVLGCIIFNGGRISTSRMDIKHAIFANCILGVLLIWVTSKANIPSTILFWLGIFSAGICVMLEPKEDDE